MATTELTYKGYTGSIEISTEDECLHGRVLFIDDLITYEGATVGEITAAFQNATDRYIAYCDKTGKPANKPYSGTFNVRIGSSRHRALAQLAHKEKTSINDLICKAVDVLQENPQHQTLLVASAIATEEKVTAIYKIVSENPVSEVVTSSEMSNSRFDFECTHPISGNC